MVNLCYSTFLQLVQKHYAYDLGAESLGRNALESITPESEYKKFTSSYLSLLWTRERNITRDIQNFAAKSTHIKTCIEYHSKYVATEINPLLEEDFYFKLENLISNDDTISPRKKNKLHQAFLSKPRGEYLAEVFLYAITKQNKDTTRKLELDSIPLLAEVDQICPLCHTPLILSKKGVRLYRFEITRIYPEFLDSSIKDAYDVIKPKPHKPDDISNKICLCDECSENYLYNPNPATYDKLLRIKNQAINNPRTSPIATQALDEKIVKILENLVKTNPDSDLIKNLRMKPLELREKILSENYLLSKAIKEDNDVYFYFIKEHLSQLDEYKTSFEIIASEIHTCFLVLASQTDNQNSIYNSLIDWILHKSLLDNSYREAAHIIVSFFVQNCEVFNAITK